MTTIPTPPSKFPLAIMKAWLLAAAIVSFASTTKAFSTANKPDHTSSWKDFYEASELRFVQLQSDSKEHLDRLQAQVEASVLQRDLAIEQAKLAETKADQRSSQIQTLEGYHETCRQQFLADIRDLQDERDRLEQRWAEECERSQQELEKLQRKNAKEVKKVQREAQSKLESTISNFESKLGQAKQRMVDLENIILDQQRDLDESSLHIARLEKERRSFRSLLGLSLQLVKRRIGTAIRWVLPTPKANRRRSRRHSVDEPVMMVDEQALLMAARRYTNGGML